MSGPGILFYHSFWLIYLKISSWRNRHFFLPIEISAVSSFSYGLSLFGSYNALLLLVMRLSDLVAKKTVQRLHQAIFKASYFDRGDKARPFGLFGCLWQVISRESHFIIFYVLGKYNCLFCK